jgi:hypothetical protein
MAKSSTSFQPGQSGHPAGRPPNSRALTAILEEAGNKTVDTVDGRTARKRLLARMMWEAATFGEVMLPNGEKLTFDPGDWLATVKWIYSHIDGPPKQEHGIDGAVTLKVVYGTDDNAT